METTFQLSFSKTWIGLSSAEKDAIHTGKKKETISFLEFFGFNEKDAGKNIFDIKEEEEQKIRKYTSFLIGRKISQNTDFFTEEQINSKIITIKSPAILRILTKWCEELW